jgi:hypothetical protein
MGLENVGEQGLEELHRGALRFNPYGLEFEMMPQSFRDRAAKLQTRRFLQ